MDWSEKEKEKRKQTEREREMERKWDREWEGEIKRQREKSERERGKMSERKGEKDRERKRKIICLRLFYLWQVVREDFFQDEAVSIGAGIDKDPEAGEELIELCVDAVLDGLSLVAVEIASGKVVSVVFNKLQVGRYSFITNIIFSACFTTFR